MHIPASSYTAQRIPGVLRAVIITDAFWALVLADYRSGSVSAVVGCLIACLLTVGGSTPGLWIRFDSRQLC